MKFPKKIKRYCPFCKKHTEHKVSDVSSGHKKGSLKRGAKQRIRKRGGWRGYGNQGRYSRTTTPKRKTKSTKKTNIMYTCLTCKKSHVQKKGTRTGKLQIEEKQPKKEEKF